MQDRRMRLTEALKRKLLVRFSNPYDSGTTYGYVLGIGPQFFILALIDDDIRFNGFECLRLADVRDLQVPDPDAEFVASALRKRGQRLQVRPKIDLSDISKLLESANRLFPLVTIDRERARPGICWIGRVLGISKSHLLLHEIGPGAVWDDEPSSHALTGITRVAFGGGYEEALHLVGGEPPRIDAAKSGMR